MNDWDRWHRYEGQAYQRSEFQVVRAYYQTHRKLYGSTPYARMAAAIHSQLLAQRRNAVLTEWLAKVRASEPKPKLG